MERDHCAMSLSREQKRASWNEEATGYRLGPWEAVHGDFLGLSVVCLFPLFLSHDDEELLIPPSPLLLLVYIHVILWHVQSPPSTTFPFVI